jgi:hypothetical protein
MPRDSSQPRRMRSSSSSHMSTSNTSHRHPQRHSQSSANIPLPGGRETGTQHGTRTHHHRPPPQIRTDKSQSQAVRQSRQSSGNNYTASTEPRHGPRPLSSGATSASYGREPPKLTTMDILTDPRLQRTTGFLPEKAKLWPDRVIPPEELDKIAWAMSLPDTWPAKRSRGNFSKEESLNAGNRKMG